ncbi:MAG TPA: FHA domain-containing protein [Gemmataceae bacterium]|nr:FHA domain-containing protein [Gemmataceae bacterium]
MALLVRIYFNAVFGALGGLLGWMLLGVFGQPMYEETLPKVILHSFIVGVIIGGSIGYFVVSVEAIRDLSLVRFCRLASYGVLIAALGGGLGNIVGELIHYQLVGWIGGDPVGWKLLLRALARGLGWMLLGLSIGVSEGMAARSLGRLSYGSVGGIIGGFVGGTLYGFFLSLALPAEAADPAAVPSLAGYLWGALGLIILGACIGSLSALVQGVMQPASLKVLRGWQEGREYPLEKANNVLGRDEHADIALFRDMKIEKRHAIIQREENRFILVNNQAPPEYTRVNDLPVPYTIDLKDGDRIQLGDVVLRFQLRAAQVRAPSPPPLSPAAGERGGGEGAGPVRRGPAAGREPNVRKG